MPFTVSSLRMGNGSAFLPAISSRKYLSRAALQSIFVMSLRFTFAVEVGGTTATSLSHCRQAADSHNCHTGGLPKPLTQLDKQRKEVTHRWPQVLPGARAVLFTAHTCRRQLR